MSLVRCALLLSLLATAPLARAIVIRDDVPDARYRVERSEFPALADLPGEGHGVLIAPQWVVTAAHATQEVLQGEVVVGGRPRAVAEVIVYPGYQRPSAELQHGDSAPLMAALIASNDIALIRLVRPVDDVKPALLYRRSDENGRQVKLVGAGATGDGRAGQDPHAPHRTALRRAFNVITKAEGGWLNYRFDQGSAALPLEGALGNGDSGSAVLLRQAGVWKLAGLASWTFWQGDLAGYRQSVYGQVSYQVRISHYAKWIDRVTAAPDAE